MYELRVGNRLLDLGGAALTPTSVMLAPINSRGTQPDPAGAAHAAGRAIRARETRAPAPTSNVIAIDKPLIGREESTLLPAALAAELGDPKVLGGPIAFVIRKGQRLSATGLDIKLGGEIPVGLADRRHPDRAPHRRAAGGSIATRISRPSSGPRTSARRSTSTSASTSRSTRWIRRATRC